MLKHEKLFTFASFSIEGDKEKLKMSGLEINSDNYIDIQVEWRDPYNKKKFDSLADVAGRMIDIHYHDMKKKINRKEDHPSGILPTAKQAYQVCSNRCIRNI